MFSAWKFSTDSMSPETLAAVRSSPFPCDTATEREFGRMTATTGTPITSSPVMFAMRVMPMRAIMGFTRSSVASGERLRCVPSKYRFSTALGALSAVTASAYFFFFLFAFFAAGAFLLGSTLGLGLGGFFFVATGGLLAKMSIFAGVDAATIVDLLPGVRTRTYGPGEYIVRQGKAVTGLFLIAEGEVEVYRGRSRRRLGAGDAFGGEAWAAKKSARTESIVKLLVLAPMQANWLFNAFPELLARVAETL